MTRYYIVASRGRGEKGNLYQHAEINKSGTTNVVTSVSKDNYVLEVTYGKQEVQGNDQEVS